LKSYPKAKIKVAVSQSSRTSAGSKSPPLADAPATPVKKNLVASSKTPVLSKTREEVARQPAQSSETTARAEQLTCRYCGSADLAPSFRERRDARCRACFKQRYGSATRQQKPTVIPKVKAAN
jgi:hypothetical protein